MEIASTSASARAMIDLRAAETRASQSGQAQSFPAAPQGSENPPQPSEVSPEQAAAAARAEAERNRPVVNTSGQLVGTRINTTA